MDNVRFIPVTERLPIEDGTRGEAYCLVFVQSINGNSNFFVTAVFYGDTKEWSLDFAPQKCREHVITHWLDLNHSCLDIPDTQIMPKHHASKETQEFFRDAVPLGVISDINGEEPEEKLRLYIPFVYADSEEEKHETD